MGRDPLQGPNRNVAFARALLTELAHGGVEHVCLAPGSRSAPLAIALADEPSLGRSVHIDERVAGFYALGLARASRRPVALVCTSGSAAAHFYPAVIEAHYARVPLVVLSADRPPELREWGAGQTIDQVRLYGSHTRWFAEAPVPAGDLVRHARALGSRAVALASGPPAGPVHLNLPFREPLDPREVEPDRTALMADPLATHGRADRPYTVVQAAHEVPEASAIADLAKRMRATSRGVIACGPIDAGPLLAPAVRALASATGWPVIADGASSLRGGPDALPSPLLPTADLFLRDAELAQEFAPDFVLRLGDAPTSKAFRLWLEAHPPAELVHVDPDATWHDPSHLASEVVQADPVATCHALAKALGDAQAQSPWFESLRDADTRARAALDAALADDERLLEPRCLRELVAALSDDALLYVASSMPIRDLDAFLPVSPRPLRVLCNRGANGIDGLVASALGAARARCGPVVLLLGDVALAHDVAGLVASRRLGDALRIVVFDNGGGGIFSFLPIAEHGERVDFDAHFLTPPDLDVAALCQAVGAHYCSIDSYAALRSALSDTVEPDAVSLLHIPIDRQANLEHFRALAGQAVDAAKAVS